MMVRQRQHEDETGKPPADVLDPATEAGSLLANMVVDQTSRLKFWRGAFQLHFNGAYREVSKIEARGNVIKHLNQSYSQVTKRVTGDVFEQLVAQAMLPSTAEPPTWIKKCEGD